MESRETKTGLGTHERSGERCIVESSTGPSRISFRRRVIRALRSVTLSFSADYARVLRLLRTNGCVFVAIEIHRASE